MTLLPPGLPPLLPQLLPLLLTASLSLCSEDVDWRGVQLLSGEPKRLLQLMLDVEMDGPADLAESFSRVGDDRIVGGQEAEPHQFPHQVGMLIKGAQGMYFCGGSLLTRKWVLTAAHCGEPGEEFTVILGAHKIKSEEPTQQRFKVDGKDVVVHPGWNEKETANDIALVPLPREAEINDYVKLIRIPSESRAGLSLWNKPATMSGWGKPSDSAQSIATELRFVTTRIVSNQYCDSRYFFLIIRDTNVCASGIAGKSTCNGDSGGPLVVSDADGKETLVGITSFGVGLGCAKSWPPAFTRVTSYLPWIANVTGGGFEDTEALGPSKDAPASVFSLSSIYG